MMKVYNSNPLPYSLLLSSGAYAILGALETDTLDIHPEKVEEYKSKGFDISPDATETPKKSPDTTDSGVLGIDPPAGGETGVSGEKTGPSQTDPDNAAEEGDQEGDDANDEGDDEGADDEGDEDASNDQAQTTSRQQRRRGRR